MGKYPSTDYKVTNVELVCDDDRHQTQSNIEVSDLNSPAVQPERKFKPQVNKKLKKLVLYLPYVLDEEYPNIIIKNQTIEIQ